jgi:phospholipase/carboxylesterase
MANASSPEVDPVTDPEIDPAVVRYSVPADERSGRPLLVLLHGYGSHEDDLFSLVESLPDEPVIASLRAPIAGAGAGDGYAWFPRTASAIGGPRAVDANAAAQAVLRWLDDEPTLGTVTSVGLLGFSQGGATVLQLLRNAPTRFAFGVQLAGFLVPGVEPGDTELERLRPPVFWGRGLRDTVIGDEAIARTAAWLPSHSTAEIRTYERLGHSISPSELSDVVVFMSAQQTR